MVGSASPLSFHDLRGVQDSQQRYVAGADGFRPANQGSLLGKIVSWLNETFRPGHVKEQNAQAYAAVKADFIASGGDRQRADNIFNGSLAVGAKFTPANIRTAWAQVTASERHAMFAQMPVTTLEREMILRNLASSKESSDPTNAMFMQAGPGNDDQLVTAQFLKDLGRQDITIGGQPLDPNDRFGSFCDLADSAGIGSDDIKGLSIFLNQLTEGAIIDRLALPGRFEQPDGTKPLFGPNFNDKTYDVRPRQDGGYDISFQGTGDINALMLIGADGVSSTTVLCDTNQSTTELTFSLVVGRDQNGAMALRELGPISYTVNAVSESGKRII